LVNGLGKALPPEAVNHKGKDLTRWSGVSLPSEPIRVIVMIVVHPREVLLLIRAPRAGQLEGRAAAIAN